LFYCYAFFCRSGMTEWSVIHFFLSFGRGNDIVGRVCFTCRSIAGMTKKNLRKRRNSVIPVRAKSFRRKRYLRGMQESKKSIYKQNKNGMKRIDIL
jgi:hypothetical protein